VYTLCCTSKLLKRAGFPIQPSTSSPTTALGNWYGNILFFHRVQLLLLVSENSRLAVITPAKEVRSVANRLTLQLKEVLQSLGAEPNWIEAEMHEMETVTYSTTHSKSVLGTMNDYQNQIEAIFENLEEMSPLEMAIHLSATPVGPLQYQSPEKVAIDLLKSAYKT
jgi:hypothetical protein